MEETTQRMPLIGDAFPPMSVVTTHGTIKLPTAFKGKWFILFSHPGDFTPVCTTEFYAFQKRFPQFRELNTELIGLSIDQVFSHLKWTEWIKDNLGETIEFPIIADGMGEVAARLGLIHTAGTATVRAVFVVDPNGIIRAILYYPAELGRNMDEFLRMIKGFQKADKEGVAIPANWPDNELVKDRVIIPPANSEEAIKQRKTQQEKREIECYDWWLCHRKP
jgi:peroxiredoxin (alkyl hydroperoxide reductase subunit C)